MTSTSISRVDWRKISTVEVVVVMYSGVTGKWADYVCDCGKRVTFFLLKLKQQQAYLTALKIPMFGKNSFFLSTGKGTTAIQRHTEPHIIFFPHWTVLLICQQDTGVIYAHKPASSLLCIKSSARCLFICLEETFQLFCLFYSSREVVAFALR